MIFLTFRTRDDQINLFIVVHGDHVGGRENVHYESLLKESVPDVERINATNPLMICNAPLLEHALEHALEQALLESALEFTTPAGHFITLDDIDSLRILFPQGFMNEQYCQYRNAGFNHNDAINVLIMKI